MKREFILLVGVSENSLSLELHVETGLQNAKTSNMKKYEMNFDLILVFSTLNFLKMFTL